MSNELAENSDYGRVMKDLEALRRETEAGREFWLAREVGGVLGYPVWREFENVIDRARSSYMSNGFDPSHQIVSTHKLMGTGKGAQRSGTDYFLSRSACYLIAMNGEPSKVEIAAAQAYFAVETRKSELGIPSERGLTDDQKRLEMREKVSSSFKRVSAVAQEAGVPGQLQGVFHDGRYKGLYGGLGRKEVNAAKNLAPDSNLFDFAAPLELSMHDFQMNLAADVIKRDHVQGSQQAIATNREVAVRVRKAVQDSGGTLPEKLALAPEPIKEVKKRIAGQAKQLTGPKTGSSA